MLGLSHVVLHLGLCSAIARLPAQATVPIHVHLSDSANGVEFDRIYRVKRGSDDDVVVEFDSHQGTYKLQVAAGQACTAQDYLFFLPDRNRTITEALTDGPPAPTQPLLLSGAAPLTFSYVKPTFVLLDKKVECKAPIGTPLPTQINVERDRDGYYTWLYSDPSLEAAGGATVALRLRTSTGLFHYVRVPMPFPVPWGGWPGTIQFNVTEDQIDELATEPTGVLLCPKLWKTTSG